MKPFIGIVVFVGMFCFACEKKSDPTLKVAVDNTEEPVNNAETIQQEFADYLEKFKEAVIKRDRVLLLGLMSPEFSGIDSKGPREEEVHRINFLILEKLLKEPYDIEALDVDYLEAYFPAKGIQAHSRYVMRFEKLGYDSKTERRIAWCFSDLIENECGFIGE